MNRTFKKIAIVITVSGLTVWGQATKDAKAAPQAAAQSKQVEIKSGSVIYAAGNDLVVKMSDGSVKHVVVPADFRFQVGGKDVKTADLKPGTQLTATVTTTTQEKTVSTVRNVDATVVNVSAPYLTVRTAEGTIKRVKVPDGTKFTVDGQSKTVFDLKENMKLKGTIVTDSPETVVSSNTKVSGKAPPPATPDFVGVLLIEEDVVVQR